MHQGKGFTLIELLVTLTIIASLTTIAGPMLDIFLVKTRVDNEIYSLQRMLLIGRNQAINHQYPVTFCPLNENYQCSSHWEQDLTVFTDFNNNQILESSLGEKTISTKAAINENDTLQYGTTRTAITYAPSGYLAAWGQNATFSYCPKNHDELSRGITVAVSGRLYLSSSNNAQTVDKNRSRVPIRCH